MEWVGGFYFLFLGYTDLDLHSLQMQGISWHSMTKVNMRFFFSGEGVGMVLGCCFFCLFFFFFLIGNKKKSY